MGCGRDSSMGGRNGRTPRIIPRTCGGKITCIFLVFIPMIGALTLAGWWMYKAKQVRDLPISSFELYTKTHVSGHFFGFYELTGGRLKFYSSP